MTQSYCLLINFKKLLQKMFIKTFRKCFDLREFPKGSECCACYAWKRRND